ncbi:LysR family transcriptional regulator [Coraliomargarita sp. SDUM461004]|uniref:LysR family transcriptional regulator n=1 Tax=Thalassobacterium sedimentorum TaxID=3041258 RepID=A0ABU1AMP8_9BACT|nr:LysR family transcriptional regulator [Coraliomargarita sp. SDUM461004]MDQ8196061.1 LysR family transcriptional regulator [Coraliomargarita sp. SDUM461004]
MKPSLPRLDPEWLSTFLAITQHGGMLAAARALHVSQPTLSARIQRLEDAVGQSLFDRSSQGMQLNDAGKRLLPVAKKLPNLLNEALTSVNPHSVQALTSPIRLSASSTLSDFVFPQLLAQFRKIHSSSGIELRSENTDEVLSSVRSGRVWLGAVEGLTRAAGLHLEPFAIDEIIPIYAPDQVSQKLKQQLSKPLSIEMLTTLPILWREYGSGTRRVIEEYFTQHGVRLSTLKPNLVFGSTMALKHATLEGMGIAFMPRRVLQQELALKRLCEIDSLNLSIQRTFSWVIPNGELPPELNAFYRWVNTQFTNA